LPITSRRAVLTPDWVVVATARTCPWSLVFWSATEPSHSRSSNSDASSVSIRMGNARSPLVVSWIDQFLNRWALFGPMRATAFVSLNRPSGTTNWTSRGDEPVPTRPKLDTELPVSTQVDPSLYSPGGNSIFVLLA